jgi:hypothetical protein
MQTIPLRILALTAIPLLVGCASNNSTPGTGGSGGAGGATAGRDGSASGGAGGSSTAGTGGAAGAGDARGAGGADGSTVPAAGCGMVRRPPTGALIDNFDGMSQVLEWDQSDGTKDAAKIPATVLRPMGSLTITPTGPNTYAAGLVAMWAMTDRPCMDASAYQGIQFSVTGTVTSLRFRVETPATVPVTEGGICTSDTCAYAHWEKDVSANVATGGMVQAPFAALTAPFGMPAAFDKSSIIVLVFLTLDADVTHSFTIDNISFY